MIRWLRRQPPHPVQRALTSRWVAAVWMTAPLALLTGVVIVALVRGMPASGSAVTELLARGGTVGGALILAVFGIVSVVIAIRLHVRHARDAPKFAGPETST